MCSSLGLLQHLYLYSIEINCTFYSTSNKIDESVGKVMYLLHLRSSQAVRPTLIKWLSSRLLLKPLSEGPLRYWVTVTARSLPD